MNELDLIAAGFIRNSVGQYVKTRRLDAGNPRTFAVVERDIGNGALGQSKDKAKIGKRVLVRVTSFRHRLLDEDNLCEKFHVDLCRYAGILPSDAPGQTKIEVSQEKIPTTEQEFVRIEVWK